VLVNNAAVLLEEDGEVLHIPEETFRVSFDTNVLVNAVDPGWVRTDRGGSSAPRSPAQGADTIVWCATLPDGGPSGGFFRDRRAIPW
jgi:NAD(P)-dependent dehydrogenase (short-subunit alcohol dehydrogenase family)